MFWFILAIALLNICLGFALAAQLGARYRAMLAMIGAEEAPRVLEPIAATTEAPAEVPAAPLPQQTGLDSDFLGDVSGLLDSDPEIAVPTADGPGPMGEDAAANEAFEGPPASAAGEPSAASVLQPRPPKRAKPDRDALAAVEAATAALERELAAYDEALIETNEKLRAQERSPHAAAIEACLASLREATDQYLRGRKQPEARVAQVQAIAGAGSHAAQNWQAALRHQQGCLAQIAQIAEGFDFKADLAEQCRQMVTQTDKLLDANHRVRGSLEELYVEVARKGDLLDDLVLAGQTDPLTGLRTRAALEAWLHRFWEEDIERKRRLCVGTIDVDKCGQINANYGRRTGDQLLHALARLLQADEPSNLIARIGGQRFVLVFPDVESPTAVSRIERIRQAVELAHFRHTRGDLRITVSGAVAEATPEDRSNSLLMRLDFTLQEAKRYGRNRTFAYEGRYPTPVVPPNFTLEEKVVTL